MIPWTWNMNRFWTETDLLSQVPSKKEIKINEELENIPHSQVQSPHLRSQFDYEFSSSSPNYDLDEVNNDKSLIAEVGDAVKVETIKTIIGLSFIGVGTMLLNPAGPEDVISLGPIDEGVGIVLVWTGRLLMVM